MSTVPWWLPTVMGAFCAASFGFWGWLAVKVIDQGAKIADIESRINMRETECAGRMAWLALMDKKLSDVREDVANIRGCLQRDGVERRK